MNQWVKQDLKTLKNDLDQKTTKLSETIQTEIKNIVRTISNDKK